MTTSLALEHLFAAAFPIPVAPTMGGADVMVALRKRRCA